MFICLCILREIFKPNDHRERCTYKIEGVEEISSKAAGAHLVVKERLLDHQLGSSVACRGH